MAKKRRVKVKAIPQSGSANNQNRTYLIIGTIVVGLIGLGYLMFLSLREPPEIDGLITYLRPSRGHDNSLEIGFGGLPPAGGEHHDIWNNCGIYDEPVRPENAVHSMEHGAVWITYHPDLAESEVEILRETVGDQTFLILSPYPDLQSPIVATAWGVQLELETADDDRIEEFIDRFRVGPQTPERGATCQNGVGQPLN